MEYFLLLFFVGIICAFVYAIKSSSEESATHTPPDSKPTPKPAKPVKKEEQKYDSIYEYTSIQSIVRCAHCDGENTYGVKVCCICGNDIDS